MSLLSMSDGTFKYYNYNDTTKIITFYNLDNSLYQTTQFDTSMFTGYDEVSIMILRATNDIPLLSDKIFNQDNGIEIAVMIYLRNISSYSSKRIDAIYDANGGIMENFGEYSISSIFEYNGKTKLMVQKSNPNKVESSKIYTIGGKPLVTNPAKEQTISLSNDTLYLSNGGSVYLGNVISDDFAPVVNLKKGWNIVGFPGLDTKTIQDALSHIMDKIISVRSSNGDIYSKEIPAQLNTLQIFKPEEAYLIKVSEECTLNW